MGPVDFQSIMEIAGKYEIIIPIKEYNIKTINSLANKMKKFNLTNYWLMEDPKQETYNERLFYISKQMKKIYDVDLPTKRRSTVENVYNKLLK